MAGFFRRFAESSRIGLPCRAVDPPLFTGRRTRTTPIRYLPTLHGSWQDSCSFPLKAMLAAFTKGAAMKLESLHKLWIHETG